jgi:REP element-mobilizing transposase RayT
MPDHLHWLFILRRGTLEDLMHAVKGLSAKRICREEGVSPPVWQPAFHDHALRNEEDLRSIARYVVANPLRAGLVQSVRHYSHWDAIWLEETLEG